MKNAVTENQTAEQAYHLTALALFAAWLLTTMLLWWFALYQTAASTPEWLLRARAVCFGTTESGLPDTYGWTVLTLAPLSFLAALIAALYGELRAGLARVAKGAAGKVALLATLLLVSYQVAWAAQRIQNGLDVAFASFAPDDEGRLPANYPRLDRPAPEFSLLNHRGEDVSLASVSGQPVILTFAFAHCRTVCPALVASAKRAMAELPPGSARLLVITLDPWRDTPGSLPALSEKWAFPQGAHLLSGAVEEVVQVLKNYNVPAARDLRTGDINHPPLVYIINPEGRIVYALNNPSPQWLRDAVLNAASKKQTES